MVLHVISSAIVSDARFFRFQFLEKLGKNLRQHGVELVSGCL